MPSSIMLTGLAAWPSTRPGRFALWQCQERGCTFHTPGVRRGCKINVGEICRKGDHEMQPRCGSMDLRLGQLAAQLIIASRRRRCLGVPAGGGARDHRTPSGVPAPAEAIRRFQIGVALSRDDSLLVRRRQQHRLRSAAA
jgi:hypothetical protein